MISETKKAADSLRVHAAFIEKGWETFFNKKSPSIFFACKESDHITKEIVIGYEFSKDHTKGDILVVIGDSYEYFDIKNKFKKINI